MTTVYCIFRKNWEQNDLIGIYDSCDKAEIIKKKLDKEQNDMHPDNENYRDKIVIIEFEVE